MVFVLDMPAQARSHSNMGRSTTLTLYVLYKGIVNSFGEFELR